MSKKLRRKIALIIALTTTLTLLNTTWVRAQETKLLPPANSNYRIEASPYQGQNYTIQQTQVRELFVGALAKLINRFLGLDETATHAWSWIADIISGLIVALTGLLVGDALGDIYQEGGGSGGGGGDFGSYRYQPQNYGALGVMGGLVGSALEGPPDLKPTAFLRQELADNIFSARTAQAATADKRGTEFFEPVRSIWTLFRDLAYAFMAVILTVLGILVMTRRRIDPRTTMTVSAALPRVAIAIILIAFSYPLAGILFDLARVLKGLIDSVFADIFAVVGLNLVPVEPFQVFINIANTIKITQLYTGGSGIFALLVALVIIVSLFVISFSLFFTLVIRFANLFVQVIFAPFAFLWGMIPGQEDHVSRWFRSFLVNTLSFPVIYFLINFALLITELGRSGFEFGLPPGLGAESWYGTERNIAGFVAFGIVLAATKVPEMLEDAFQVTPSAHVARAGVEPTKIASRIPVIGGLFK